MADDRPSAQAMRRFVRASAGLHRPHRAHLDPELPTLPDLKKRARDRRAAGLVAVDQSAGDIDDVGQPLHPGFGDWVEQTRDALVAAGHAELRRVAGAPHGYPGHYQQQYPAVTERLAASWGIGAQAHRAVQTMSGRNALDLALRGLVAWARAAGRPGPFAIVLDPLAWSGYLPLAEDLGLALIHMPAVDALVATAEGLREAAAAARAQGLDPIAALPIVPSNPTGLGLAPAALASIVDAAAREAMLVLVDAFYSPLAPEGHAAAVGLAELAAALPPELLGRVGVLVGETKVTSSQNKTSTLFWLGPSADPAKIVMGTALERLKTTNTYPRPHEAVVAAALHTFPGGLQAAMGPRYEALDAARRAMAAVADARGLPLSIGGSFYGTLALVDAEGRGLLRDTAGEPLTRPRDLLQALADRFGLIGAPGGLFSPAPEAGLLVRLTAAVSLDDVARLDHILGALQDGAAR